jgi:hypothetical protein
MKKKLKLDSLKIQSFITETEKGSVKGAFGGDTVICLTGNYPTLNCLSGEVCLEVNNPDTIVPTRCGCTGYYPSLNAPCDTIVC